LQNMQIRRKTLVKVSQAITHLGSCHVR
jgi:hypothetical protein